MDFKSPGKLCQGLPFLERFNGYLGLEGCCKFSSASFHNTGKFKGFFQLIQWSEFRGVLYQAEGLHSKPHLKFITLLVNFMLTIYTREIPDITSLEDS